MSGVFLRQFCALVWKNWIVLGKHPILNTIRCFILPVAYGIFLSAAQDFFVKRNNFGIADPVAVRDFRDRFDGSLKLIWADDTGGKGSPSANDIVAHITRGFNDKQLAAISKVETTDDIPVKCPQNFNLFSECFAGLSFGYLPSGPNDTSPISYTILGNGGFGYVNAIKHTSDYELYVLPLQWAVDQAIIELRTGAPVATPLEWPFSNETNEEEGLDLRLSYIRGLRDILVLALFIAYIGIAYHLPGSFAGERANLLTSHLKAMGLKDSARIISWHISLSTAYLPSWIIMALVWKFRIFAGTNVGIILLTNLLLPLSLASWTFFLAAPFGKSPQLAAITSVLVPFIFAILALVLKRAGNGLTFIFTILFPSGFYIFAIRAICGFENRQIPTSMVKADPDNNLRVIFPVVAAIINIFLWPYLAVLLERKLYDPPDPTGRTWYGKKKANPAEGATMPPDTAISVQNLGKIFRPSFLSRKAPVTAVADLSFDVPKHGIFVLLGSNGAGKSTSLSIIGGLLSHTSGRILFEGANVAPPRGTVGIVPQKNVLFPELTCHQTLRLWHAVKVTTADHEEDIDQLLRDCDLEKKINANASTLSGGQKRKLQLAIGLVGGSKIVLVDECTSGVDPLSRRALWRTLNAVRYDRTIVFTTHFLDEADLLADNIAILAAPGKLVAQGSPVSLKRTLGQGYTVEVRFHHTDDHEKPAQLPPRDLLPAIRVVAPHAYVTRSSPFLASYHLMSKDPAVVESVLQVFDQHAGAHIIDSYDIRSTSIEDIFLDLMNREETQEVVIDQDNESKMQGSFSEEPLQLSGGRKRTPMSQTLTIFHKRALIAKRAWLPLLMAVGVAIAGSCIPLFFLNQPPVSCVRTYQPLEPIPLFLPALPIDYQVLVAPASTAAALGSLADHLIIRPISDNQEFVSTIQQNYHNIPLGGISLDLSSGQSLIAWETDPPGTAALTLLNLVSNIVYNARLNATSTGTTSIIGANYATFPLRSVRVLRSFRWLIFFGAAMAVYPAFFSLYVSRERRSSVQAMQLSNGLANPFGLWLGHLMFDSLFTVFVATVIITIFSTVTNQFNGVGFLWLVMVLYGITATLWAYCVSLFMPSPLASFAFAAGYQVILFLVYLVGYLVTFTYAQSSKADGIVDKIHWAVSITSPVASIIRAAFVSVNLFNLLCSGDRPISTADLGQLRRFGGPILYLIVYGFVLFGILVWWDSGAVLPFRVSKKKLHNQGSTSDATPTDVAAEAEAVVNSQDSLRVVNVTKVYGGNTAVDNVSFGVARGDVLALLGPNGAGKTTTFDMIRGDVAPTKGDIFINGISVTQHPRGARLSLGVCPQFTAIDAQLTVREHLEVYGRLKGIPRGPELDRNVDVLLKATALVEYTDRLASQLSGGNQRKLALAIAMMGNPTNLLIDEFSTGIDAKMKRDMWSVLRNVAVGKAVAITTHSMEEASALANKAGILATRMLAVGTVESLAARYPSYEVHFACRTREEATKAQQVMSTIPGAKMAEDVATRFEVPVNAEGSEHSMTLLELFRALSARGEFSEYTVERSTLETTFLKVIRENEVAEEDTEGGRRRRRSKFFRWLS